MTTTAATWAITTDVYAGITPAIIGRTRRSIWRALRMDAHANRLRNASRRSPNVNETKSRPAFCTDEHLEYLDMLRDSGATNMFGAAPYLAKTFEISKPEARAILGYWMDTFGKGTR